jgi:hypothetical protein
LISGLRRKFQRGLAIYQEAGLSGLWNRLRWRLRSLSGRDPDRDAWIQYKKNVDRNFDAEYGVKTGGIEEIHNFQIIGENSRYGRCHIATDPVFFQRMMTELNFDWGSFTFVDLGSGRGRALMLASAYPFRRIVGVEFAAELHSAAKENIAAFGQKHSPDKRIELVHGDALAFDFPNDPLIVFLFNSFTCTAVRKVAYNILDSWGTAPRPIRILYMNQLCLSDFLEAGWKEYKAGGFYSCLTPPSIEPSSPNKVRGSY